jgi:CubicO group peptidase (beta-lactamase class C family)
MQGERIHTEIEAAADELVTSGAETGLQVAVVKDGQVVGFPVRWAFGYSPGRPGAAASRPGSTFGMVGANGSAAYADIDSGVAVAVMRNRFTVGDLSTAARIDGIVAGTLT